MIRACFPLLLPHNVKVERIWLLYIHELLREVGRGTWQRFMEQLKCWLLGYCRNNMDTTAVCTAGLQPSAPGKNIFPQSRAGGSVLSSVTLLCTSRLGDNWNPWVMKGWWSLVWKMWPELFTWCLCLHWKAKTSWGIQLFLYKPLCGWKSQVAAQKFLSFFFQSDLISQDP